MLSPETRTLLTDALRPPDGYRVDVAVATTYSLNLTALLLAPLSFALHEYDGSDPDSVDPIKLLESVRRYADTTTVFCQGGAIHVPPAYRPILAFTESCVHEVLPPDGSGLFHPKIWVIRFASADGDLKHRFLCLSRNLTFDRSWDTMLRLDETDTAGDVDTAPLVDFITSLEELVVRPLPETRRTQLRSLSGSLARARLTAPEGADRLSLRPLGLDSQRLGGFPAADHVLAISPFLDKHTVERLAELAPEMTLLSRPEAYERLGPLPESVSTYVLQRAAEVEVGADLDEAEPAASELHGVPEGLHAKTFVFDRGDRTTVITGSANATRAGFAGRNVEFNVEFEGPRKTIGVVASWDGTKEAPGLSRIVQLYDPPDQPAPQDPVTDAEWSIQRFHAQLAAADLTARVDRVDDGRYTLTVDLPEHLEPVGESTSWPISVPRDSFARPLAPGTALRWGPLGTRSVTPYLAVETSVSTPAGRVTRSCVVNVRLAGDPESRRHEALRDILTSRLDVLRYLVFLLGDPAYDAWLAGASGDGVSEAWFGGGAGPHLDLVIFEPLVRAAARGDTSLRRVASLVEELARHGEAKDLLPDGFEDLWQAVWSAVQNELAS